MLCSELEIAKIANGSWCPPFVNNEWWNFWKCVFLMQYTLISACTKPFSTHWTFFLTGAGTKKIFLWFFTTFFFLVWDSINTQTNISLSCKSFCPSSRKFFPKYQPCRSNMGSSSSTWYFPIECTLQIPCELFNHHSLDFSLALLVTVWKNEKLTLTIFREIHQQ